jgi:Aldo/keto reductase family
MLRRRVSRRQSRGIGGAEILRWRQTASLVLGSIALVWGMKGYCRIVARWQSHLFPTTTIVAAYSSTTQQKQPSSSLFTSSTRTCRFTNKMTCSSGTLSGASSSMPKDENAITKNSSFGDMPLIGWGTYLIDKMDVAAALRQALALGYRRIDCAPVYFNEDAIGDALHEILSHSNESVVVARTKADDDDAPPNNPRVQVQRSDLYIVSKLPSPFHRHVEAAVRKTLHDLRLDYLDLYLGAYRRGHAFAALFCLEMRGLPGFAFSHAMNVFTLCA